MGMDLAVVEPQRPKLDNHEDKLLLRASAERPSFALAVKEVLLEPEELFPEGGIELFVVDPAINHLQVRTMEGEIRQAVPGDPLDLADRTEPCFACDHSGFSDFLIEFL